MTRYILSGMLALISVGVLSIVPVACQSGGVGDPCTPEDEYQPDFGGFELDLSDIESRSFQCTTRICLVNHFQGRVSCPLGQGTQPTACDPIKCTPGKPCASECTVGSTVKNCVVSQVFAPSCGICDGTDPTCVPSADGGPGTCPTGLGLQCLNGSCVWDGVTSQTMPQTINQLDYYFSSVPDCTESNGTSCSSSSQCVTSFGGGSVCTNGTCSCPQVLQTFTCHTPGACQLPGNTVAQNTGLDCCVPGTDTPVDVTVCGQCGSTSKRDATQAVYCSCRCCAPCCPSGTSAANAITQGCSLDMSTCGTACDPNFNYCSCPSGFTCSDIRAFVGLGDQELAGAYCIQAGTDYVTPVTCGVATGGNNMAPCQQ